MEPVISLPFQRDEIHRTLRRLLVQRPFKEGGRNPFETEKFSKLIMEIKVVEGMPVALTVLKEGAMAIDNIHKSYLYQGLARLVTDSLLARRCPFCRLVDSPAPFLVLLLRASPPGPLHFPLFQVPSTIVPLPYTITPSP